VLFICGNAELLIHTRRDFVNRFLKGDRFIWDNVKSCNENVKSALHKERVEGEGYLVDYKSLGRPVAFAVKGLIPG
jgi:hypothetical protein